ncbi:VCBS domain-containing protein [Vibrio rumoiensis]|uniref:VCBS domain-containing protein n=1 Tax=Vibrio rumoiensis TaxID=76258 RepID=UPI003AA9B1A4
MSNEKQNQPTNKSSDPTIKVVQKQDKDVQRMKANALRGDSDGRFSNQSVADDVANKSWKVEGTSAVNHQELNIATDDTNINTPLSEPTPQAGSGIVAAPNSSEAPQSVTGQVIPTHQNEDGVTTYAVAENHASNYVGLSMTPTGAFTYVPTAIGQSGQSQTIHLISIHNDQSTTHQMLFINNGGKVQVFMDVDNAVIIEDQNVQGNFIHSIGHQDESITDSKVSGAVVEVMQGKYGTLTVTETGDWDYALDNTQLVVQQLKPGEDLYESFTAQVFNHGLHQINIDIKGAEDKAVISGVNTQTITEDTQVTNGQLETSGKLDIVDIDHDDAFFQPQSVMGLYGEFTIDQDGHWTYQANNTQDKIQSLAVGEQLQDVITVTSKDAGTTHDVTVTITGTNDAPVLVVTPNAADFSQGQLTQTDVDTSDTHTFTLVDGAGQYGVLVLDPMTQSYSYSQYPAVDVSNMTYDPVAKTYSAKEVFEFHVDDNHGGQDIQFITLDITAVATAPSQPGGPAQITTSIQTPPMITDNMPVMPLTTQTHQANVVTIDLDAASDSGVSNTDDLTNDFMPTITGHTDMPFSQVEIFEGSQSLGTTTSDGNGRYSLVIAPLTGDADGILHSLFAQATAPSAQSSVISANLDITVDTQTASAVADLNATSDTYSSVNTLGTDHDDLTSETLPSFVFSNIDSDADTVEVFDGSTSLGQATLNSNTGNWEFIVTNALSNGDHDISATVTDKAGNLSSAQPLLITIDSQIEAPQVALTTDTAFSNAPGSDTDNKTSIQGFDVTNIEPNAVVEYSLDKGATWSTQAPSNQVDGQYTLLVRQTDVAGNVSRPTKLDYVIDSQTASPVVDLDAGSDSHSTNNSQGTNVDDITSETTPSFTLTGIDADASQVEVFDGSNSLGFATQGTGVGSWVFTTTSPLADGQHDISAVVTDNAGNVSTQNPALHIGIDTQIEAPQVVLTTDTAFSNAPGSDTDNKTSVQGFDVTNIEPNAVVEYSLDKGATWSTQAPSNQADGQYALLVRQTDVAGNVSSSTTLHYEIDSGTAAPVVDLQAGSDSYAPSNPKGTDGDDITSNTTPSFTLTGIDADASQVEVFDGPNSLGFATQGTVVGSWVFTATSALSDGIHNISAVATDNAGNVSTQNPVLSINVDTQIETPVITLATDTASADNVTYIQGFNLSNIDPSAVVEYSLDGGTNWTTQEPNNQVDGDYSLLVRQTDVAGNSAISAPLPYTVDTSLNAPSVDLTDTSDSSDTRNAQGSNQDDITNQVRPTFELLNIDNDADKVEVFIDGNSIGEAQQDPSTHQWTIQPTSDLAQGSHEVTAIATDIAGNVAQSPQPQLSIWVDTQAQSLTISLQTDSGSSSTDHITNTQGFDVQGVEPGAVVEYRLHTTSGTGSWTTTQPSNQADGTYTLETRQIDIAGNESQPMSLTYTIDNKAVISINTIAQDDVINAQEHNQNLTISGTTVGVEDGQTVTVELNQQTYTAQVQGNSWTLDVPAAQVQALTDGSQPQVTVSVTDIAGNTATDAHQITIDTTATISIDTVSTDDVINAQEHGHALTISGDTTDVEDGQTVTVVLNGQSYTADVQQGQWALDVPAIDVQQLSDNVIQTITASVADKAGNSVSETHDINVDITAQIQIDADLAGDDVLNAAETGQDFDIKGTVIGVEDNQDVTIDFNGQHYTTQVTSGTWSFTVPATDLSNLKDGDVPHIQVSTTDLAGNLAIDDRDITVDTQTAAPVVDLDSASDSSDTQHQNHGTDHDDLTKDDTPTLILKGIDSDAAQVEVFDGTTSLGLATQGTNGEWTITVANVDALSDGVHSITATVTDNAGNTNTSVPLDIRVDTVTQVQLDVISNKHQGTGITENANSRPVISGTAEVRTKVDIFDNGNQLATVDTDSSGHFTYNPVSDLSEGLHEFTATATDVAGNQQTSTPQSTTIDTQIAVDVDITDASGDEFINAAETSANSSVISGHIDADAHLTSLIISDGTDQVAIDVSQVGITPSGAFSVNGVDLSSLADGRLTVTAKSMDDAGNTATHSDLIDKDTVNNAQDDSSSVKEESTLKASGNVLNNDNEPDAQTIDNVNHKATVDSQSVAFDSTSTGSRQHGTLTVNADGDYEYVLDNSNTEVQALGEGVTITDTFTYTVLDPAGNPKDTTMTVTITGTNDIPAIGGVISNDVTELVPNTAKALTTNGQLNIDDTDTNVNQSTYPNGEQHFQTAVTPNANAWGSLTIDADGHWQYSVDNSKAELQALQDGDVHIDTFTVTSIDGSETQDITITINGTADAPVITSSAQTGSVIEDGRDAQGNNVDTGSNSVSGKLDVTDVDQFAQGTTNLETAEWTITEANGQSSTGKDVDGVYGRLHIDDNGKWTYDLDNTRADVLGANDNPKEVFTVTVTDSTGLTDTQTISIDVQGTNDMPVISGTTIGQVVEDGDNYNSAPVHSISGDLTAQDPDQGDSLTWSLKGATAATPQALSGIDGTYGRLVIDDQGHWEYQLDNNNAATNALSITEHPTETFTVLAMDSSGNVTEQEIVITVQGSNDNPVMVAYAPESVDEGTKTHIFKMSSAGDRASDVDNGDVLTYHPTNNPNAQPDKNGWIKVDNKGWLRVHQDTGEVKLNTNAQYFQHLHQGAQETITVPVTVSDGQGGSAEQTLTIEVTGTNDTPTIQHVFYDSLTDQTGSALNVGTAQQDISGQNASGSHNINEDQIITGHFDFKDPDDFSDSYPAPNNIQGTGQKENQVHAASGGDTYEYSVTDANGHSVSVPGFRITNKDTGEYTFNAGDDAYQHLQVGDTENVKVNVTITDNNGGTDTKTLTFNVKGTNDAPVITASSFTDTDEDTPLIFTNQDLLQNVNDIDSTNLAISNVHAAADGTVKDLGGGRYQFIPDKNFNGDVEIQFSVDDGRVQNLTTGSSFITVNPVNDAPTVDTDVVAGTINEDGGSIIITEADLLQNANAADVDTNNIAPNLESDSLSIKDPANVQVDSKSGSLTYDAVNHQWEFTPAPDWNDNWGVPTFTFTVTDGKTDATHATKATIHVTPVDDPADIHVAPQTTPDLEATPSVPSASGQLEIIDPDKGQDHFNPISSQATNHGFFSLDKDGHWQFTLDPRHPDVIALSPRDSITDTVTVTSPDGKTSYDIDVVVKGDNEAPVLAVQTAPIIANEVNAPQPDVITGNIVATDADAPDKLTYRLVSPSAIPGLTLDTDGTYHFDQAHLAYNSLKAGEVVEHKFSVIAQDQFGATDTQTYAIRITGTNDAPEVTSPYQFVDAQGKQIDTDLTNGQRQFSFSEADLLTSASDPDGDLLHVSSVSVDSQYGTIIEDGQGGYTFKADANVQGDVELHYEVTDGALSTQGLSAVIHIDTQAVSTSGTSAGTSPTGNNNQTPSQQTVTTFHIKADAGSSGSLYLGETATPNNYIPGLYGYLQVDATGHYEYFLYPHDSNSDPIKQLAEGEARFPLDKFAIPGSSKLVTVYVDGVNDSPIITGETSSTVDSNGQVIGHHHAVELGESVVVGHVTAIEIDNNDYVTFTVSDVNGQVPNGFQINDITGHYHYQPDPTDYPNLGAGQSKDVTFTVTATDTQGAMTEVPITFTVHGQNTAPTADATVDLGQSDEDTTLTLVGSSSSTVTSSTPTFDLVGLSNAVDPDGDKLHITNVKLDPNSPLQGHFQDIGGGRYEFIPASNEFGIVHFTYEVTDGLDSTTVSASLTVDSVNDVPTYTAINLGHVDELDQTLPVLNVVTFTESQLLAQASDVDVGRDPNEVLSLQSVALKDPSQGSLTDAGKGNYQFVPADDFNGKVKLDITVVDHAGEIVVGEGTITVDPVNDKPIDVNSGLEIDQVDINANPLNGNINEDNAQTGGKFLVSGQLEITDVDSGEGHFIANSALKGQYGQLSIDADGNWQYQLMANHTDTIQSLAVGETLEDVFHLATDDNGGNNGASYPFKVTIHGAQDKAYISVTSDTGDIQLTSDPQITNLLVNTPNQVTAADVTATGKLTVHDVDTSEEHFAAATQAGTYGSLTITDVGDWTYTADNNQMALQQLSVGETVTETFTVSSADGSAKHDITVTLTGENNVPVITAVQTQTIAEDASQISGQLSAKDIDNDADISAITYAVDGQAPVGFTLNSDGSYSFGATDSSYQSLAVGESRDVTVDVVATDNQSGTSQPQSLTFTVTGTNDAPVITPITAQTANEGDAQLVTGTVTSSDVDNGATATYSTTATVAGFVLNANGSYRFDPSDAAYQHLAVGVSQDITIPVTVTDEHGTTDSTDLVITITGTNDAPVLTVPTPIQVDEDGSVVSSQLQATDIDGDALTYALAPNQGAVDGFSIKSDGSYSFDASHATYQSLAAGETQDITIELQVSDGKGGTDTQVLNITVTGTNDAPTVTSEVNLGYVEEDNSLTFTLQDLLTNADDVDHHATLDVENHSLTATNGTVTYDATTKEYTYTPTYNYHGDDHLAFNIIDGQGDLVSTSAKVTINSVNDTPVFTQQVYSESGTENNGIIKGQLSATDIETPDDQLQYSFDSQNNKPGWLTIHSDGSYEIDTSKPFFNKLTEGEHWQDDYNVVVTDKDGGTSNARLHIEMTGTNDGPTVTQAEVISATDEDRSTTFTLQDLLVQANDADRGEKAQLSITNHAVTADHGSVQWNGSEFEYTPEHDYSGDVTFSYQVVDPHGEVVDQTATMHIDAVNDDPVVSGDVALTHSTGKGMSTSFTLSEFLDGASDVDSTALNVNPHTLQVDHGTLTYDASQQSFHYDAYANYVGDVIFSYDVIDGDGGSVTQHATMSVYDAPDDPVISQPMPLPTPTPMIVPTPPLQSGNLPPAPPVQNDAGDDGDISSVSIAANASPVDHYLALLGLDASDKADIKPAHDDLGSLDHIAAFHSPLADDANAHLMAQQGDAFASPLDDADDKHDKHSTLHDPKHPDGHVEDINHHDDLLTDSNHYDSLNDHHQH